MTPALRQVLLGSAFYPGAAVALDFIRRRFRVGAGDGYTGVLTALPGVSFTRASVGYAKTSGGVLVPFQSGQPRITDRGLLVEESRTNSIKDSGDQTSASWTTQAATVARTLTAPDGTPNAATLVTESTATGAHDVLPSVGNRPTLGAVETAFSVFIAANSSRRYVNVSAEASGNGFNVTLDTQTGALTTPVNTGSGWTVSSASVESFNGWYRVTLVGTPAAAVTVALFVSGCSTFTSTRADSYTGTGASWGVWGFQAEAGAFSTSYIPTTSASATRAADAISVSYAPDGSAATVTYGTNSTANPSATSPINLGASSGGAWVDDYVKSLVVTP